MLIAAADILPLNSIQWCQLDNLLTAPIANETQIGHPN